MIINKVLGAPWFYDLFQTIIKGYSFKKSFLETFITHTRKISVLDIGCGTGFSAKVLKNYKNIQYVGLDFNQKYIAKAKNLRLKNAKFYNNNAMNYLKLKKTNKHDIIIINGFLHHLDIKEIKEIVKYLKKFVKTKGVIIGIEPIYHKHQKKIEKIIMSLDRGKSIFTHSFWRSLFAKEFKIVKLKKHTNLFRVPYSVISFSLSKPY